MKPQNSGCSAQRNARESSLIFFLLVLRNTKSNIFKNPPHRPQKNPSLANGTPRNRLFRAATLASLHHVASLAAAAPISAHTPRETACGVRTETDRRIVGDSRVRPRHFLELQRCTARTHAHTHGPSPEPSIIALAQRERESERSIRTLAAAQGAGEAKGREPTPRPQQYKGSNSPQTGVGSRRPPSDARNLSAWSAAPR